MTRTAGGLIDAETWAVMSDDAQSRLVIEVLTFAIQEKAAIVNPTSRRIYGTTIAIAFCDSLTTYDAYVNIQHARALMQREVVI